MESQLIRTTQRRDLERRDGLTRRASERRAETLDQALQAQDDERRANARRLRMRRAVDQALANKLEADITDWAARYRAAQAGTPLSR